MQNKSNIHLKPIPYRVRGISQRRSEHFVNQKQQIAAQYSARKQQARLSSLFQSFENIITTLFNQNAKRTEVDKKAIKVSNRSKQIDYRDRIVTLQLPDFQDDRIELKKLQTWVGEVCNESLSVAFHYFMKKKMNYDQMKAFASECLLRNLVILIEKYKVTPEQINFIDKTMKDNVFPYQKAKYPMTAEKQINKMFKDSVKSIDNSEILANDYFSSSKISFEYRQNGRYDDIIMMLINEIMSKVDGKIQSVQNKETSNFLQFKIHMTEIFQKSFDEGWMAGEKNEPNMQITKIKAKDQYRQAVEQYTSFLIGRKISQNTQTYSEEEIKSKSITIKSPTVLRTLTKWADELWSKFENENYFMQRSEGLGLLQNNKVGILLPQIKTLLTNKMKAEKEEIEKFLQNIEDINYKQQIQLLQNQLESEDCLYIEKHQRIAGKFACKIVNNIQSFIIDYLNRLIHGLTKVSKQCYSQMQKRSECHLYWPSPFNLLSFKISDILRCKYASKQKEVLKVFNEIVRESRQNPERFKIIRIKNRLKNATNDILINAKFNNTINCEIQIAVNALNSDFMECSNKINHYIYELERSRFGPILQMCSIWRTYEKRSQIFNKLVEKEQPRQQSHASSQQILKGIELVQQKNPFVCSQCSKHYYHNNFFVNHLSCREMSYWKCAKCLIMQNYNKKNKDFFFKYHTLKKDFQFCDTNKQIPANGGCIWINRSKMEVLLFKKIDYNFKKYLIHRKDKKPAIMREVTTKDQVKKFFNEFLVFKLPQKVINDHLQYENNAFQKEIITNLFIPDYLKKCFKQQKQTISIVRQDHLSQVNFDKIIDSNRQRLKCVKAVEFSVTKLKNLDVLSPEFVNLTKLNINVNDITDVSRICEFKKLQTLYMKQNHVAQFPSAIGTLKELKEIDAYENKINALPQSFSNLNALVSLNLSKNQFSKFPDKLQKLQNLRQFYASSNQLTQFPNFLKKLKNLEVLNLNGNQIEQIPDQIPIYLSLKELSMCENKIGKLPKQMQKMTNLRVLEVSDNQIEEIPLSMTKLTLLQVLNINKNRLKSLPDGFENLSKLHHLNLKHNSFQSINSCIFNLSELGILHLANNKISSIEDKFDKLTKLKRLTLNANKLKKMPSTIHVLTLKEFSFDDNPCQEISLDDFPNLTCHSLSVSFFPNLKLKTCTKMLSFKDQIKEVAFNQNKLEKYPNVLFEFKNLEEVQIRRNKITLIPDKFKDNLKIVKFEVPHNSITGLPASFANLKTLQILDLTANKFSQIPQAICKLQNLKQLKLGQNMLKELPQSLKVLKKLNLLDINSNHFEMIPKCVGQLISLMDFYAQSNQIKEIPIYICVQESIQRLNLKSNQIEKIPKEICGMKGLEDRELQIFGNPIKEVEDKDFVASKVVDWMKIQKVLFTKDQKEDQINISQTEELCKIQFDESEQSEVEI